MKTLIGEGPTLTVRFDSADLEELLEIIEDAAAVMGSSPPRRNEDYNPGILEDLHLAVLEALVKEG